MLLEQVAPEPVPAPESAEAMMMRLTGIDIHRCPYCHQGRLRVFMLLAPTTSGKPEPKAAGPPCHGVA